MERNPKEYRNFATIDVQASDKEILENRNEVEFTIDYLGKDATGTKVNDHIPSITIFPALIAEESHYMVNHENHFWLLAKDCTIAVIDIKDNIIQLVLVYEPVYQHYPIKCYHYKCQLSKLNELMSSLILETESPFIFYNTDSDVNIHQVFLKISAIRLNRINFRLFKPLTVERDLLKIIDNSSILTEVVERVWIPRREIGIVKYLLILSPSKCITCQTLEDIRPMGTIIGYPETAFGLVYTICNNCIDELDEKSFIQKLLSNLPKDDRAYDPDKFEYPTKEKYFDLVLSRLKEEDLKFKHLIKKNGKELQVVFNTNCILIISYNDMLDYAYIFMYEGKEKFKWDSRDDHKTGAGLDHFHFDPEDYNKNVKSSYFTGNFLLDFNEFYKITKPYITNKTSIN